MDIAAFGLATAFGIGSSALIAALAEENEALTRRPDLIGCDYQPQLCAFAPDGTLDNLAGRVLALIAGALQDLSAQLAAQQIGWPRDARLVLLTPAPDHGLPAALAETISMQAEASLRAAGWVAPQAPALRLQGGAGGTARALQAAAQASLQASLQAGAGGPVLVVMADSHACRHRLNALLAAGSLFSKATPWGFVPGEAACAALILPDGQGARPGLLRVSAACEALEPVPEPLNQDSAHTGLTDAALAALEAHAARGGAAPARLLTDWNNSRYRAAEFSYTQLRLTGLLSPTCTEADHPVQRFGQCGAGWLAAVLAHLATVPPAETLILSGDEGGAARAALILSPPIPAG